MGKLQTVLIPKNKFNIIQAINWILKHKLIITKIDITKNYYRFRQSQPCKTCAYYSFKLPNDIIFVLYE